MRHNYKFVKKKLLNYTVSQKQISVSYLWRLRSKVSYTPLTEIVSTGEESFDIFAMSLLHFAIFSAVANKASWGWETEITTKIQFSDRIRNFNKADKYKIPSWNIRLARFVSWLPSTGKMILKSNSWANFCNIYNNNAT